MIGEVQRNLRFGACAHLQDELTFTSIPNRSMDRIDPILCSGLIGSAEPPVTLISRLRHATHTSFAESRGGSLNACLPYRVTSGG